MLYYRKLRPTQTPEIKKAPTFSSSSNPGAQSLEDAVT